VVLEFEPLSCPTAVNAHSSNVLNRIPIRFIKSWVLLRTAGYFWT
jgi:hypothetical protein